MPAGPVEGLHEQPSRLLPFRMLGQERLQACDGLLDQAERQQQPGLAFGGDYTQFLQPGHDGQCAKGRSASSPRTGPR